MPRSRKSPLSRRQFLGDALRSGAAVGAAALWPTLALAGGPATRPVLATVVRVRSRRVTDGRVIRVDILGQMIETALLRLTGRKTVAEAWQAVLGEPEKILLKFRADGAGVLQTSPEMATALVGSLTAGGCAIDRLSAAELASADRERLKLRLGRHGHSPKTRDFGSGKDQLALSLLDAGSIVNVPFLTDDRIFGVACAIKGMAYRAVRHPARMHATRGNPQLADIYALPEVGGKVRLHICNAVRAICDGGPSAGAEWLYRGILMATDPVALDVVALEALELERRRRTVSSKPTAAVMPSLRGRVGYLKAAERKGIGIGNLDHIRVIDLTV